jgi:hypothetical protein
VITTCSPAKAARMSFDSSLFACRMPVSMPLPM